MTCDMWHMTCDIFYVTCDICYMTCGGWIFSQNFRSPALAVCDYWYLKILRKRIIHWINDRISDKGVCKTALATAGLFKTIFRVPHLVYVYYKKQHIWFSNTNPFHELASRVSKCRCLTTLRQRNILLNARKILRFICAIYKIQDLSIYTLNVKKGLTPILKFLTDPV